MNLVKNVDNVKSVLFERRAVCRKLELDDVYKELYRLGNLYYMLPKSYKNTITNTIFIYTGVLPRIQGVYWLSATRGYNRGFKNFYYTLSFKDGKSLKLTQLELVQNVCEVVFLEFLRDFCEKSGISFEFI